MKIFVTSASLFVIFLIPVYTYAQREAVLRNQIALITKPVNGIVGISVLGLENKDTLTYNGNARLVMESVMKFPMALTVLHLVDTGKLSLGQMVHITKRELPKNTYSPLRDKYPKGVDLPLSVVLGYMVSESDNNACDILLKLIGGTKRVQSFMLQLGIRGIAVRASEADIASARELEYVNWAKPFEMTALLDQFYNGKALTKNSTGFLYKLMTETITGPMRLKGLLPAGTILAHKTGTSGTDAAGLTPATNDVGIITLPDGKHLAIAVFVCNSTNDEATREGVIAKVAKAVYDFYGK
ncbi:MAG TPA: class A beta-lactamase, subclass A2 [Mucilaginibacter sp.]